MHSRNFTAIVFNICFYQNVQFAADSAVIIQTVSTAIADKPVSADIRARERERDGENRPCECVLPEMSP